MRYRFVCVGTISSVCGACVCVHVCAGSGGQQLCEQQQQGRSVCGWLRADFCCWRAERGVHPHARLPFLWFSELGYERAQPFSCGFVYLVH